MRPCPTGFISAIPILSGPGAAPGISRCIAAAYGRTSTSGRCAPPPGISSRMTCESRGGSASPPAAASPPPADVSAAPAGAVDSPPTTPPGTSRSTSGCSCTRSPTGCPVPGPSPDALRTAAEPIDPAHRITSRAAISSSSSPPGPARTTPSHRPPTTPRAQRTRVTWAPVRTRTPAPGGSQASNAVTRRPPRRAWAIAATRPGNAAATRAATGPIGANPGRSRSAARANPVAYRRGQSGPHASRSRGRAGVQYPPLTAPDPPRVRPRGNSSSLSPRRARWRETTRDPGPTSSSPARGDAACSPDSSSSTSAPASARRRAITAPAGPAPTTTTSALTA